MVIEVGQSWRRKRIRGESALRVTEVQADRIYGFRDGRHTSIKRFVFEEQYEPCAACYTCGLPYDDPAWIELSLPHDRWALISPSRDENGLLCAACIAREMARLGWQEVPVRVFGPFTVAL